MRNLSNLQPTPGSRKRRKRVGRGDGSGDGKYSGRGIKGQKARTGHSRRPGFEGGQTPLWRRIPKRGFVNPHRKAYAYVNIDELMAKYDDGAEVTPEDVLDRGIVDQLNDGLKVLGRGECDKALTVYAHRMSQSARQKIEAAGGHVTLLETEGDAESDPAASEAHAAEDATTDSEATSDNEAPDAEGADAETDEDREG